MYTTYYGLKEEAFRLTPDPRFLHLAEPHREVLTSLVAGVLQRKGIVVATGPVGTGKTTLLHATLHFLASQPSGSGPISTAFLLNPTLNREELLEAVLDEFQVTSTSSSKPRRLAALHEMLLETQRKGGTTVLVIDEAHLLTVELLEEIRLLTNADTHREKLLQVILSGQPELLTTLRRPQLEALKQRIASRSQLRALSLQETRVYVAERLQAAGLRGPSPLMPGALDVVHGYTQGVPRLINLLCDKCLMIGSSRNVKNIAREIVEDAATALDILDTNVRDQAAEPVKMGMSRTTLDVLIEALKHDRAMARE
jgi:general secretion pathway protein A